MSAKNSNVDFYFEKAKQWKPEIEALRNIILGCELKEELKWGCPCYVWEDKNVVLIHTFKEYCAVLFFKGALLSDKDNVLIQQTENVQATRQMRFTNMDEVNARKQTLQAYVHEATEAEKQGLKINLKKTSEFSMTEEFKNILVNDSALQKAFEALTPGRQRGYLLFFSQPKQSKTRTARIEKSIPAIMEGKGLND